MLNYWEPLILVLVFQRLCYIYGEIEIRSSMLFVPLQSPGISWVYNHRVKYLTMKPLRFFSNRSEYQSVDKRDVVPGGNLFLLLRKYYRVRKGQKQYIHIRKSFDDLK